MERPVLSSGKWSAQVRAAARSGLGVLDYPAGAQLAVSLSRAT